MASNYARVVNDIDTNSSGDQTQISKVPDDMNQNFGSYSLTTLDWSLKTKIRFLSSEPFDWCQPLRACDEAESISEFLELKTLFNNEEKPHVLKRRLKSVNMLWQHPVFPWLKLFPRLESSSPFVICF